MVRPIEDQHRVAHHLGSQVGVALGDHDRRVTQELLYDAIVDAIAIFSGKRTVGTLPDGVDARYLLGIVRNVHHRHEAESITEALIRERLSARDRFLAPLVAERDAILTASFRIPPRARIRSWRLSRSVTAPSPVGQ